uniref:Enoyl reductase (ER) domain-containing protein n=1 Tax=Panagrolaimus sp. PS1159 TaxID=55785 RepID=A0AC35FDP7_9BILA
MPELNIPKTQRALICDEVGSPLKVREIPVPEPGPDELLVKIHFSGVCHSDMHIWLGEVPIKFPSPPAVGGHEGSGVVVKVGENVTNFKVGDRAGVKWINGTCLNCDKCKLGFEESCATTLTTGGSRNGTFQEYALIKASEAPHIPDNVDMAKVAPVLCAGLTVYRALKDANVRAGQIVAITGAGGGLGSMAIQYAKAMGMRVLALDIGPEKEKHCKKLGAEFFVDPTVEANVVEKVLTITKGGPHGVVHIATSEKPLEDAFKYVRTRGTIVIVSLPKDATLVTDIFSLVLRVITIKGSYVGSRADMDEAIDFFARGLIDIPIEIYALEDIPKVYDRLHKGDIRGRVVIDLSK